MITPVTQPPRSPAGVVQDSSKLELRADPALHGILEQARPRAIFCASSMPMSSYNRKPWSEYRHTWREIHRLAPCLDPMMTIRQSRIFCRSTRTCNIITSTKRQKQKQLHSGQDVAPYADRCFLKSVVLMQTNTQLVQSKISN